MKVLLLYPPAGDVRAPQLALPSLAAFLSPTHTVQIRDLNLEAVLHFLQPDVIHESLNALKQRDNLSSKAQSLVTLAPKIIEVASQAPRILRTAESFFDPHQFNTARDSIQAILAVNTALLRPEVVWSILPLAYEIKAADPAALTDILSTTATDEGNVFAPLWRSQLLVEIENERPDVIGITLTNRQQWWPALYLARLLKAAGYFVVLGGALLSKFVNSLQQLPVFFETFCHVVIMYEGEHAFLGLLNALENKKSLCHVPNLLYLENDEVHVTPTFIEDVPTLPTPDFGQSRLDQYFVPYPVLPILTGKGCYFNRCKFCDIPYINHVSRKPYRVRPVDTIVQDIQELYKQTGCKNFLITDEALAPKLLKELALALKQQGLTQFSFTGYARFEAGFTQELCDLLGEIGFKKLYFGLESASQRTIDHMDKGVKVEHIIPVLKHCHHANIAFHIFSIIGFPQESESEARKTFEFFLDNQSLINQASNSFDIHPFGLQLHTAYFKESAQNGIKFNGQILNREFVLGLDSGEWTNQEGLSAERVAQLINDDFYPQLRRVYQRWHNTPLHLWSGFEEYATLYSDWYSTRTFTAITSIAHLKPEQFFTAQWHPIHAFKHIGDEIELIFIQEQFRLPTVLVRILEVKGVWSLLSLTAACYGAENARSQQAQQQVVQLIHTLAGLGVLQLNEVAAG